MTREEIENTPSSTFNELVDRCLKDFDQNGSCEESGNEFSFIFFLAYQWYTEPVELLDIFRKLYDASNSYSTSNPEVVCKEQICQAIHYWINQFGDDFKATTMVHSKLDEFQAHVTETLNDEMGNLMQTDKWIFSRNSKKVKPCSVWRKNSSLSFSDLSPTDIAEQLTYLDWKGCIKISFVEWKLYVKTAKTEGCSHMKKQIALFNNISKWVTAMILGKSKPEERAELMKTFTMVAKELVRLGNFNCLMAVMGGITHTSIGRLQQTKTHLPHQHKLFLKEMTDLLAPKNNYGQYRSKAEMHNTSTVIPILGVVMKDLVAVDVALPDFSENSKINFWKMVKLADALTYPHNLSKTKMEIVAKKELLHLLRVSLQCRLTEEELYNLSLEREPRVANVMLCKTPQLTEEVPVFAEWASGCDMTPDRKTVEKYVDAMVEAVFKIYDADKSGTISKDEFENIASNFPYIENFAVLDVNCDGTISKEEMRNYFMNLNSHDMTKDFLHNFQETTFFAPTYCEYCMGFLWGIGKAGYKCKDCSIACHKDCHKHVVLECRPRSYSISSKDKASRAKQLKKRLKYFEQQFDESGNESSRSRDSPEPPSPQPRIKNVSNSSSVITNGNGHNGSEVDLKKVEEERDRLYVENDCLQFEIKKLRKQAQTLQRQRSESQQRTVQFLIETMSKLDISRQTDV